MLIVCRPKLFGVVPIGKASGAPDFTLKAGGEADTMH